MWMKDGVPWMKDRVIAFYTVCLLICRERGPMGLLLPCLHSRILVLASLCFAFKDFYLRRREFVFAFSVYALLHLLEPLDISPRTGRESTMVVCADWAEVNNVRKIHHRLIGGTHANLILV